MWISTITNKSRELGSLVLTVEFSVDGGDGSGSFKESFKVTDYNVFQSQLKSRLSILNATDALESSIILGKLEPQIVSSDNIDHLPGKLVALRAATELASLGVIDKNHPTYVQALAEAQAAFNQK